MSDGGGEDHGPGSGEAPKPYDPFGGSNYGSSNSSSSSNSSESSSGGEGGVGLLFLVLIVAGVYKWVMDYASHMQPYKALAGAVYYLAFYPVIQLAALYQLIYTTRYSDQAWLDGTARFGLILLVSCTILFLVYRLYLGAISVRVIATITGSRPQRQSMSWRGLSLIGNFVNLFGLVQLVAVSAALLIALGYWGVTGFVVSNPKPPPTKLTPDRVEGDKKQKHTDEAARKAEAAANEIRWENDRIESLIADQTAPRLTREYAELVKRHGGRIEKTYLGGGGFKLDLTGTSVTDKDLLILVTADTTSLTLSNTTISDAGLVHLKGRKLRYLNVKNTRVTSAGLDLLHSDIWLRIER